MSDREDADNIASNPAGPTWKDLDDAPWPIGDDRRPELVSREDANVWDGNATPLPLSDFERDALRMLAQMMLQPDAIRNARRRLAFIREAYGDGRGMDPAIVAGVRWATQMFLVLELVAASVGPEGRRVRPDGRGRHVRLNRGRSCVANGLHSTARPSATSRRPRA